ncbi:MAG: helix-turn-helix domain-containing protein [Phycisphaerae bacterium]|nr:helix-turn-helix domain-containing protein [Phycisphaerae bacterium]
MTDRSVNPEPLALRPREAAAMLGLSARTLWSLTARGAIPSFKVGRATLYSVQALREWVQSQSNTQTA